jgi:hypothetical protein
MTLQDFQRMLRARPFQPFRVVMSSGEQYEVRHPEMAFLTRTSLVIGLDPDKQGIAEGATWCSLLHVSASRPIERLHRPSRRSA